MRSYVAGMLTVLSNRIGDVALLMVIAWIINTGNWSLIYYLEFFSGSVEIELISFLVVLTAMTRSAQIPFSCMFISILYMFRAAMCPSSGELLYQCDAWFMSLYVFYLFRIYCSDIHIIHVR